MVGVTILDELFASSLPGFMLWSAAGAAWIAASLLIRRASTVLRIQVGILLAAGVGILWYAGSRGAVIDPLHAANSNLGLLTMIASVGFLRLVTLPAAGKVRRLPVGRRAYLQTVLGVGIFASVINISAPILIADRIHREHPLGRLATQSIIRVFCAMSNWSPFFGAMAAVLITVTEASLGWIVIGGLPIALLCVIAVLLEARWRYREQVSRFVGYPLEREALLVPAVLLVSVGILSQVFPGLSILVIIAVCALLLTVFLLYRRQGGVGMARTLGGHVTDALPAMVGELSLFLAAGVLATAMSAMIEVGAITSPFTPLRRPCRHRVAGHHGPARHHGNTPHHSRLEPDPASDATGSQSDTARYRLSHGLEPGHRQQLPVRHPARLPGTLWHTELEVCELELALCVGDVLPGRLLALDHRTGPAMTLQRS